MNADEEGRCDVVRRFFAALSDGDLEAMRPMLHPDATWEVIRAVPGERLTGGGTPSSTSSSNRSAAGSRRETRR